MARRISLSMPVVDPILDRAEQSLVERSLAHLRERCPQDSAALWAQVKRAALVGEALDRSPSLSLPSTLGGTTRDEASLVAHLSHLDPHLGELSLPEKAVLARAFLAAKIAFLRAFLVAVQPGAPGAHEGLAGEFRDELAQSIYTAIATEILVGLLCDGEVAEGTKIRAASQLIRIWDRATEVEIDDFCPLLESAWKARRRVSSRFGALLGTSEYTHLVEENCPHEFLDYFTRDAGAIGEAEAFEEFLFNLTHEELVRVRTAMRRDGRGVCDPRYVQSVLERPLDDGVMPSEPDALYRSYCRRRTAAEFRRFTLAPGPHRVAEAYLMAHLLDR